MADANSTSVAPAYFSAFPGLDPAAELVVCTPYSGMAEYQGTRAQKKRGRSRV